MVKADLKSFLQRLTAYKRPTNIIIQKEALPKTTTGKIKRKDVKEMVLMYVILTYNHQLISERIDTAEIS